MTNPTTEALRGWFRGVEAIVPELYNAGCAMCASPEQAREALQEALLEVWMLDLGSGAICRERLRAVLRREALAVIRRADENGSSFPGLRPAGDEDALMALAAGEEQLVQRMILLRYGCGLNPRMIAPFVGLEPREVRAELARFEGRCRRQLPRQERARIELRIAREARRALCRRVPGTPPTERVYRDFEAAAMDSEAAPPRAVRILGHLAVAVTALICALMFWLFAVISVPAP